MTYVEIIKRGDKKYYYLTKNIRIDKNKWKKIRKYLGNKKPSKIDIEKLTQELEKDTEKNKKIRNKQQIEALKKKIVPILKKYKIKKAGIFGSYARGNNNKKSDIDILVQYRKGMGLEFVGMGLELEEKLKKKVDLVTYKYIHPKLKDRILKEEIKIL